ncbi:MAG: hypothetical protein BGP16_10945 [Sphingobium sp. 66-54]|nr:MAG: hypothetical protein BGP16_10945 [Sphingobium sp. 66-54]
MSDSASSPAAGAGAYDWRRERRTGILAIAVSGLVSAALWFGVACLGPLVPGMEPVGARMVFALKCCCLAALFCLVLGVEAVAHERLQSPAFDPLMQQDTRRLRVNLRYLQNTLEQFVVFAVGLFGLALYSPGPSAMRAVLATAIVWVLARFAFWMGYHHSAAMRGLGAPGMAVSLLVLLYVGARIGEEVAGVAGAAAVVALFLLIEALLFWKTRAAA